MIFLRNTPNFTGAAVHGDRLDFEALQAALERITGERCEWPAYEGARLRVLGVCEELGEALKGNRGRVLIPNEEQTSHHDKNLYLAFNIFWPELIFVTMALNEFVDLYISKEAENSYRAGEDYRTVWDSSVAQVRSFQSAIAEAFQQVIPASSVTGIMQQLNSDYFDISHYAVQYLDDLNFNYLEMDKEMRREKLITIAKQIAQQGSDYQKVKQDVQEAALKNNGKMTEVAPFVQYPAHIEW
ncbi:hypothetical protein [Bacillus sp. FJAT-27251]|uniref:DUF6904 family protein n=1 Tax=Bacillus sp. FJAT-27251 TaxID=1684142 RepID=UPI0006A767D7|nr:hypothetical protein [Bacillus sp. FJAT-27251]